MGALASGDAEVPAGAAAADCEFLSTPGLLEVEASFVLALIVGLPRAAGGKLGLMMTLVAVKSSFFFALERSVRN